MADDSAIQPAPRKPRKPKRRPSRFEPDPSGRHCDAHTRADDRHLCDNPSGFKTDHPGIGRCHLHGGRTPARVGRYSEITRQRIRELIEKQAADPEPLSLLPELALLRALVIDFIERYDVWREALLAWWKSWNTDHAEARPHQVLDIADAYKLLAEVGRITERIERVRAANAISRPELLRVMSEMGNIVTQFVTNPDDLRNIRNAWAGMRL